MSQLNLVMSLKDFYPYVKEIIEENDAVFYIEHKKNDEEIIIKKVSNNEFDDNREKFLLFFILSQDVEVTPSTVYEDDIAPLIVVGEGGRTRKDSIEHINLRVLAKTPEKSTIKIFNAIKNKLKKDNRIGMGVKGGSKFHDNYFYQKEYVGKKVFKTDFNNSKAPVIEIK